MPPTIAISEFMATRPEMSLTAAADMTLNPNQPTHSSQEPNPSHGSEDGGMPIVLPPTP